MYAIHFTQQYSTSICDLQLPVLHSCPSLSFSEIFSPENSDSPVQRLKMVVAMENAKLPFLANH